MAYSTQNPPSQRGRRNLPQYPVEGYTIAWICATETETKVARAAMDNLHRAPKLPSISETSFQYGAIRSRHGGEHGIIIVQPNAPGKFSITRAVSHLKQNFPNLTHTIFVGIAGALSQEQSLNPDDSANCLQKGDVVVAFARDGDPAVIQYDYVDDHGPDHKRLKHVADKTSWHLQSAFNTWFMEFGSGDTDVQLILNELVEKNQELVAPDSQYDILFSTDTKHVGREDDCSKCLDTDIKPRRRRDRKNGKSYPVQVYRGLVVTGDRVIRSSESKKEIKATRELRNALCVDMESAVLMDDFHPLVIRGISDYADSHYGWRWTHYAAATAAAVAKDIICEIQSQHYLPNPISQSGISQRKGICPSDDDRASLQSLYFPEMFSRQENMDDLTQGTFSWFPGHPLYLEWLKKQHGLLLIKGHPGTGKSTLMKHALALSEERSDQSIVAAYFFQGSGASLQKSILGLFRSLVHQVLRRTPELLPPLTTMYLEKTESQGAIGKKWDWREKDMVDFFSKHILTSPLSLEIYIDAIDEGGKETATKIFQYFNRVTRSHTHNLMSFHLCISCRWYPVPLETSLQLDIEQETGNDMALYIRHALDGASLGCEIFDELNRKAAGNFLWAKLTVDKIRELEEHGSSSATMWEYIRKVPIELGQLYQGLLEGSAGKSLRLLEWVCFAARPLTLRELRCATIIDAENMHTSIHEDEIANDFAETEEGMKRQVRYLSKGLIELSSFETGYTAQFIHETVKEHLQNGGLFDLAKSASESFLGQPHFRLATSCVKYICLAEIDEIIAFIDGDGPFDPFSQSDLSPQSFVLNENYPFLSYATFHWKSHVKGMEKEPHPELNLLNFFLFEPFKNYLHHWGFLFNLFGGPGPGMVLEREIEFIHVAASFDLLLPLRHALETINDFNLMSGESCRSPLHFAADNGHLAATKLLLQHETVLVDLRDFQNFTPLHLAAVRGHMEIVQVLLRHGADPESKDQSGNTPLIAAIEGWADPIVQLLLDRQDVDAFSRDCGGRTPISRAAESGSERIVQMLLDRGIDPDSSDENGMTPLSWAAGTGHEEILRLLLQNKANVNSSDINGKTPLSWFTGVPPVLEDDKYFRAAKLLLEQKDIIADLPDKGGRTPLLLAAREGRVELFELLSTRNDVDPNTKDENGRTPLAWAAGEGHCEIVKLLLERNKIDADAQDKNGRTSLSLACEEGYEYTASLLMKHHANPELADEHGRTALSWAAENGMCKTIQLLLLHGADASSRDKSGRIALDWAEIGLANLLQPNNPMVPGRRNEPVAYETAVQLLKDAVSINELSRP